MEEGKKVIGAMWKKRSNMPLQYPRVVKCHIPVRFVKGREGYIVCSGERRFFRRKVLVSKLKDNPTTPPSTAGFRLL